MEKGPTSPLQAWGNTAQLWASFPHSPKTTVCSKSPALRGRWVCFLKMEHFQWKQELVCWGAPSLCGM